MLVDIRKIRVVFDGPPSHESGRFVEVEDTEGHGLSVGEWIELKDGLWALEFTVIAHGSKPSMHVEIGRKIEEA